jgi:hypothetical protein
MAKRTWTVTLPDDVHTVELTHYPWPGATAIRVDGHRLTLDGLVLKQLMHVGAEYAFYLAGHRCAVYIYLQGLGYRYVLAVDGRDVDTGQMALPVEPMPIWSWVLLFACLAVPLYVRDTRIALVPALVAAVACWLLLRRLGSEWPQRFVGGVLLVILTWSIGIVFNGGLFASWDDTNYWIDFAPDGGVFTVSVPQPLHSDTNPLQFNARTGPLSMHSFTVQLNRVGYWVDYGDIPGATNADPQRLLAAIGDSLAEGADVQVNTPITLGSYPGREIAMVDPQQRFNRLRLYLVGGRLYDIWAIAPNEVWNKAEIAKFLDSLRLRAPTPTPGIF